MNIEINNENDLINILNNEEIDIFKVKYSNKENPFRDYENLIKSYKIDFFKLAIEALSSNQYYYQVADILVYLIPYSELNVESIIEFFKELYRHEEGAYYHYKISNKLSQINLEIAKNLLKLLLKENELYTLPHISAIQVTLHNKYKIPQFDTVIGYLKSKDIIKLKSAIGYLHHYDFLESEYRLIFEQLKKIPKLQNKELDKMLIYESSDMLNKGCEYEYFFRITFIIYKW